MAIQKSKKKAILLRVSEPIHEWVKSEAAAIGVTATGMYRILIMESRKRRLARVK